LRTSRRKLPFGVAQAGKSFRNEITPGNFVFRTREFEQMEIEYFVEPGMDDEKYKEFKEKSENFLKNIIGLSEDKLKFVPIKKEELPHYSKEA
jgi:glycyl-tRNA synthetase